MTTKNIKALLNKINKPAVKTIQSPDGDIIDCVPFHLQPAFDHPLLKGLKTITKLPKAQSSNNTFVENFQVWTMSGERCPDNTVPIRRTTTRDILKAKSVETYGRKIVRNNADDDDAVHEHAVVSANGTFLGAKATINVWYPHVAESGEFSLAQIWVLSGSLDSDLNSMEAGWQVLYGDKYPKFFIYWTADAYQGTGCYNLECSGFVQTSQNIVPGAAIRHYSTYNGPQYNITLSIEKSPKDGHWWLKYNEDEVGYWPKEIFTNELKDHATTVDFGGEIVDSRSSRAHTTTQMGSGHFPNEGYGKAAYIRNIEVLDENYEIAPATELELYPPENPKCYWAGTVSHSETWGNYMFFGGPGRNDNCP
ncbi:Protein of Unknown Function (DUF239 [Striga hermonthica]|uniref:Neprosin PEP catalytic domain-containing protein n=1 Tax=Striga hermonthica TaxID=68872 RepID=A0A9N7NLU2_STRHE|nr:Protein of Unknown Function (DUF239 [Striga hermonthica]